MSRRLPVPHDDHRLLVVDQRPVDDDQHHRPDVDDLPDHDVPR